MREHKNRRRGATRAVTLCAAIFVIAGLAAEGVKPINGDVALHGYDAVAYFSEGKPVKGLREFEHRWQGATWRFTSKTNRDAFAASPERYAPQYGGYCAYAVSQGHTADIDPEAFSIVGGRLYLNYSKSVKKKWDTNQPGYIQKGNSNWPKLVGQ
jgi:YHS domain-containing protein